MAVILTVALVIGLMPGVTVTADADSIDYKINDTEYKWTGSDETIVLSGESDSLTIINAPTAAITFAVQSDSGSDVTINGGSVNCDKTKIIVLNDITLNLNNVDITAPSNASALELNSGVSVGAKVVNITGTNNLRGMGTGCGVRSDSDRNVVISGSGILNALVGGEVSGADGGNGIMVNGDTAGSCLTIQGDVTVNATGGSSSSHSGGAGILAKYGNIIINSGTVNATSGGSKGTNLFSAGITAIFKDTDHTIGGNITIEGGHVTAQGGDSDYKGAYGVYAYNKLNMNSGSLTANGGKSVNNKGGTGVMTYEQNLEVNNGTIKATGGDSGQDDGGIAISNYYKDIVISGGTVIAKGGESTTRAGGNGISVIGDGELKMTGGSVKATGGNSSGNYGGAGINVAEQKLEISGGILTAIGGDSENSFAGTGIIVEKDNIEINGGSLNITGGSSTNGKGGRAIHNKGKDIIVSAGSVTAVGGQCTNGEAGRGLELEGDGNLQIRGGSVVATGGNGGLYGAHAVFAYSGTIFIDNGANVTAVGGKGTNNVGGVGLRAYGNTVTIANNAGNVYVRGGQGVSAQRASIMGKDVYIGTGNIGGIVMEGSNPRSIKNNPGGEDVYQLGVKADPAAAITLSSTVSAPSGNYIYRATTKEDGVANMWLPAGTQTVSASGYRTGTGGITADDTTKASITLSPSSNNASVINILTKTDTSPGSQTGADAANAILWDINVDNTVSAVAPSNITVATGASKNLYSDSTFTSEITGSDVLNLIAGSTTTVYVKVTSEDGSAIKYYAVAITRVADNKGSSGSGGSGGGSKSNEATTQTANNVVEVNGQRQDAGEAKTVVSGGKTVITITVDDSKLDKILDNKGGNPIVTLPTKTSADVVVGELNGQTVKNMEKKKATLEIKTGSISYTLPASQINIDNISEQVGKQVELKDIRVSVKIAEPDASTVKAVQDTANKDNYQIVVKPVSFEITCTSGSKTIDVSKFNGYVQRMVTIPDGVDPNKITTGIVLNADGTFSHVPTVVTVINGKYYAKINSLTNSTYSVIYNKVEFNDVKIHWAKNSINNMGSRLVVSGDGNGVYRPNSDMTRAEFAAIIGKALGLRIQDGKSTFSDVKATDWYNGYTMTAASYGIVTGYNSSTFAPNDKITREQAMTMIARAMKITGLGATLKESDVDDLLGAYEDAGAVSSYAKSPIAECLKAGVVSGKTDKILAPKDYITRAEVAVIVERLLQNSELIQK